MVRELGRRTTLSRAMFRLGDCVDVLLLGAPWFTLQLETDCCWGDKRWNVLKAAYCPINLEPGDLRFIDECGKKFQSGLFPISPPEFQFLRDVNESGRVLFEFKWSCMNCSLGSTLPHFREEFIPLVIKLSSGFKTMILRRNRPLGYKDRLSVYI